MKSSMWPLENLIEGQSCQSEQAVPYMSNVETGLFLVLLDRPQHCRLVPRFKLRAGKRQ